MNPFAVAEIEGGSDALRENVCRGRVVEPGSGGGDVERLIRIGRGACTRGLLTYLKFRRYYSISLPGFIPRQKSEAVRGLGTRPGYN